MKHFITAICLLAVTTIVISPDECQAGSRKHRNGSGNSQRQSSSGNGGRNRFKNGRQQNRSGGNQSFRRNQTQNTRLTKNKSNRKVAGQNFKNRIQNHDRQDAGFHKGHNKTQPSKFQKDHRGLRSLHRVLGKNGSHRHNHSHNHRPWYRSQRRHQHANHWCFQRPTYCHWWFDYCTPLATCHATDIVSCNFVRCSIPQVALSDGNVVNDATWYLGLKGMILPQSGLGIDEIEANSPAAQAGLTGGMIIISCNDIQITEESDMQRAIATSGGVLRMVVQFEDGTQGEGIVQLVQTQAANI